MTHAFVLSGGASLGSIQVGMLAALQEAAIRPDLIVGSSVGALNGAWLAGHPGQPVDELAATWRGLSRSDVFPAAPLFGLAGFAGLRRGFVGNHRLRRLIEANLTFARIEDSPIPLHIVVTDVVDAADVRLSGGDIVPAVLASAAIPGVFPPVEIAGRTYMDGGVVNNTPISHAVELGADTIWVLPTGWSCALASPPKGALGMALHGLNVLVQQRLAVDIAHYSTLDIDLRVLPPPCPVTTSPADFGHAGRLIEVAHDAAAAWLSGPGTNLDALVALGPHDHSLALADSP